MIINAGIERVFIETAPGRYKIQLASDWIKSNLKELEKVKGRWRPVMPKGY
jgi:hypothetical protein